MGDHVTRIDAAKIVGKAAGVAITGQLQSIERNRPAPRGARRARVEFSPGEAVFSLPVVEVGTSPRYYLSRRASLTSALASVQAGRAGLSVDLNGSSVASLSSSGSPDSAELAIEVGPGDYLTVSVGSVDSGTEGLVVQVHYS